MKGSKAVNVARLKWLIAGAVGLFLVSLVYNLRLIRIDPLGYGTGAMEIIVFWGFALNAITFVLGYRYLVPAWLGGRSALWLIGRGMGIAVLAVALKIAMVRAVFALFDVETTILRELAAVIPVAYLIFAWGLMALGGGARFAEEWIAEQRLRHQVELQRTAAELAQLKHQVNPHFLFNTLNNLYALAAREGAEQTAEAIMKLAGMMRYMLHEVGRDMLPLESELAYLRTYIDLQKMRIPANRDVTIELEVTGDPHPVSVPPMMMITLVENAFKHGVSFKRPSAILMDLTVEGGRAIFRVRNRMHAPKEILDREPGGFGLANLAQRLAWYAEGPAGLDYGERDGWFEATLVLPMEGELEMHRD
ncbi:Histidine kinase [Sulfidibacter corallicola]|uniref:Histidine kinase n=1 Tax=Sulfidibacter corallicola TaxID=2818388 RepID=A0A8A4TTL1_SULCO|nr:histidine kinase [Sulfidibacter corallicola]QTD52823.1 histidine kinase [Sulfidibacter corallicola]